MVKMVFMAIIWLHPEMAKDPVTKTIATAIVKESAKHNIDPLLVVAKISTESQFKRNAQSKTHDWGLMQVHVSKTTYSRYLGREKVLLSDVRLNIMLGVKMLGFWKRYHRKHCKPGDHYWWVHYQHGKKVIKHGRAAGAGRRVLKVYQELVNRFYFGNAKAGTKKEETAILAACGL
jgi:hypothetical protein